MAQTGQQFILEGSLDGGATWARVGFLRTKSFARSRETVDATTDEDAEWASSLSTMRSFSFEAAGLHVFTDEGQQLLEEGYASDDPLRVRLTDAAGPDRPARVGDVHVTQLDLEGSTNELVSYSVSMQSTGPVFREAKAVSGGEGTTETTYALVSPGTVRLDYEMYQAQDSAELVYDGEVVATTGGPVSGAGTLTFDYPGGTPREITVRIVGVDPGTGWDYTLYLP